MKRPGGVFELACVCFLLVLVLGAVESGRVAGTNYKVGLSIPPLGLGGFVGSLNSSTTHQSKPNGSQKSQAPPQIPNPAVSFPTLAFLPAVPDWLLTTLGIVCFAGVCFLILRLKTDTKVVDLEETLREMELQQKRLAEIWSYRLRNMALLRYYLLMRRACSKIGLKERLEETPKEYIERASSFLNVDNTYATRFADTVNRCRYGEELSGEEAGSALKFMGDFTELIRRRTNAP